MATHDGNYDPAILELLAQIKTEIAKRRGGNAHGSLKAAYELIAAGCRYEHGHGGSN